MSLSVSLVSPEKVMYEGAAKMVIVSSTVGEIGFLAGHQPYLGALKAGPLKIVKEDDSVEYAAVHGGFIEVRDDRVIVLSDIAEMAKDIDKDRAEKQLDWAQAQSEDDAEAQAVVIRANARLLTLERSANS